MCVLPGTLVCFGSSVISRFLSLVQAIDCWHRAVQTRLYGTVIRKMCRMVEDLGACLVVQLPNAGFFQHEMFSLISMLNSSRFKQLIWCRQALNTVYGGTVAVPSSLRAIRFHGGEMYDLAVGLHGKIWNIFAISSDTCPT
ncbi:hypothetical protein FPV67DRAFT_1453835 [Lyophyllum atratum]|nr:hypothetical protein FPV67DRAFT_1453835 [Lyophyllum atratum]